MSDNTSPMQAENSKPLPRQNSGRRKTDSELGKLFVKKLPGGFRELLDASLPLFEKANTPTSLALWLMLKYREYDQYLRYEVKPESYTCHVKFRRDWQCLKVFSKSEIFPRVVNTRKEAVKEYIKCEMDCASLNSRIMTNGFRSLFSDAEWQIIHLATRKIAKYLGPAPSLTDLQCHFGPGLNVGLDNQRTSVVDKLSSDRTVTRDCLRLVRKTDTMHPMWDALVAGNCDYPPSPCSVLYEVVPGSRLTFVPKNAKTDRPICVEPLYNSFLQTGVGSWIRSRLKKTGCDLNSQTVNQRMAKRGSETNSLATVDLSSASDTIAFMVVLELLPIDWFELLFALRSPSYSFEGCVYPFEKFSSMGNAYTFELESLLFLAITRAVTESQKEDVAQVSVYGDDIICPSACFPTLYSVLGKLGFRVSAGKSFTSGPFRESCGKDYFLGMNVRPIYLKSYVSPRSLMVWLNGIRRAAGPNLEDPVLRAWYLKLRQLLPKAYQSLRGPDGYGDGHLIVPYPSVKSGNNKGWEGHGFYSMQAVPSFQPMAHETVHALASYAIGRPGLSDSLKQNLYTWPEDGPTYRDSFVKGSDRYNVVKSFQRWEDPYNLKIDL